MRGSGIFRALRYPDFFWYWSSYFVSNVGAWMQNVAQGWLLFEITDSPLILGLFSLLRTVMLFCFFLLGGLVADRWDRRLVMMWIQIVSLITAFVLAILVSLDAIRAWHIFILGAITSTAWAFEQPVRQSLIPKLVSREDLVNALALNSITWQGAGLLGPSLVGLLVDRVGIDGCFYINAVSYFAIIWALFRMNIPPQEAGERAGMTQSFFDGLRYIRHQKLILTLLIGSSCVSIFGRSYIILLPVFAKEVLHIGASGLGFIAAAPGLGTIIGALTLAALGRVKVRRRVFVSILVGSAVALFIFATGRSFATAFPTLVVVGALGTVFDTLLNTLIQLTVADVYRGRVMGVYGLSAAGLREFGGMQAGFIAEWAGAPLAIQAGAVVVVLVAFFFFYPQLRRLPET
ncbi:MAG TPA: MFS transporter [Verrucomicrobiae bacterium]|jgi:MFS family permease|nr:MFS transporter [Verrucomicrobiae bacterium]